MLENLLHTYIISHTDTFIIPLLHHHHNTVTTSSSSSYHKHVIPMAGETSIVSCDQVVDETEAAEFQWRSGEWARRQEERKQHFTISHPTTTTTDEVNVCVCVCVSVCVAFVAD